VHHDTQHEPDPQPTPPTHSTIDIGEPGRTLNNGQFTFNVTEDHLGFDDECVVICATLVIAGRRYSPLSGFIRSVPL
jgi:hypothetical protein